MKKMVILNITHGNNVYSTKRGFLPIAAGACRDDIINDACGEDNISCKNKYYGDFTSLYWAWKNLKGVDIIGTSHYRRYIADIENLIFDRCDITWSSFCRYNYSFWRFRKIMNHYDIILVRNSKISMSNKQQYLEHHPYPDIIELVEKNLNEICPEYLSTWRE